MEFWGVEVKPGQTVKCEPGEEKFLHLSQASLGEIKKDKGAENVPISVKINDQNLILGTLSAERCAQIQYDLVFEKEFELSHGSKNTSVFFVGYKSIQQGYESEDDFYDSDSEDDLQINQKANGKGGVIRNDQGKPTTVKVCAAKAKAQTGKADKADKPKSDGSNEEDDDDDGDNDGEMAKGMTDSDDSDDESSEDEEADLKTEINKKRASDGVLKTPVHVKKAKVITSADLKTGGDGEKGGQPITPHNTKQTEKKTPASGDKAKQKTSSLACKSCSKSFNIENALQAHIKAKHSGADGRAGPDCS